MSSLAELVAAGSTPFYMTAEEGQDLVGKGHIVVNPNESSPSNPKAFRVLVTEAGKAAAGTLASPTSKFAVRGDVAMPKVVRGNPNLASTRVETYPFSQMKIGQSFHCPCSAADPEPWKKLGSSVSAANARNQVDVQPPQVVQKDVKKVLKDAHGNKVLGPNGKPVMNFVTKIVPKTAPSKKFKCFKVGKDDPDGPGARVFRVALD